MLNELEQKIRKAIPESQEMEVGIWIYFPIQLNHVLEYALKLQIHRDKYLNIISLWNLKSNILSDQSEQMWMFLLELKKD